MLAGVAAAHHLAGLFPGHREHHPANQQPRVVLLQPRTVNDAGPWRLSSAITIAELASSEFGASHTMGSASSTASWRP